MKLYLSSFKLGNEEQKLKELTKNGNNRLAYIHNAMDHATDLERRNKSEALDITDLQRLGYTVDVLDLKQYFHKPVELEKRLDYYDVLWVRGGNTFVLAQAMRLSGFDKILQRYFRDNKDIVYGGYSAGICILGTTLKGIHLADDPNQKPYGRDYPIIWEGMNILDYALVPHYKSEHPESEDVDKIIAYMIDSKIPFKALRDGEVIIIE
ncbi:Type 1 glutamine amidotransferase-like domain-containing protein [Virgibacillus sp. 179-BFC.A HS]|uniref:Type 1 glutamine amidotransferase-like domain-containing protein n=1 Tax=Tigheibacillus jepli TaxID=3035914 RepID=A0ABU5CJ81_9BACI|nr:Type 1 glutamine amidotransferase-like domain-containing protein [Virgibacillus sp. 179-BFC.A HS]MDY0406365.1 Type 1 glutamine amidotransferase-like domain-containing protein [Virgibacillus sp. 179-BFC.A HS]